MAKITGQTKMTISRKIQWSKKVEYYFCVFFKILTITPVQCRKTPTGYKIHFNKSMRFFSYLVIILIFLYAGATISLRLTIFNVPSEIHIWNEITNITGLIITSLVILIESQFTYKHYSHIIQLKRKIEDELRLLCSKDVFESQKYLYIKNYWRLVVCFHLIAILTEVLNLFYFQKDSLWRFYACWFIIPVIFTRFRCFQHRFFTEMIHLYIKLIRMKIQACINEIEYNESLARQKHCRQFNMNSQKMFLDLNSSMHVFTSIFRMSCSINKMFGFSLLAKIFENFIQTLSQFFWIYSKLYHQDLNNITGILLRVFPTLSIIIMMLASCENCTKEMDLLTFLITTFEVNGEYAKTFDLMLESFSLQLMHERIIFSVVGFFRLNFTLLRTVIAGITTYTIIFIQFMPKMPHFQLKS